MGRSTTPGSVIMMPEEKPAARYYQQLTPQTSFQASADQMRRIEEETAKLQNQRYDSVGTPAELGAKQKGYEMQSAASYLASLPTGYDRPVGYQATPTPFARKQKGHHSATWKTPEDIQTRGDQQYSGSAPNVTTKFQPAVDAAAYRLANATQAYTKAKQRADTQPRPTGTISPTPSWAQIEDKTWLPKEVDIKKA